MISERQEKLLKFLVEEYINNAEPVSSDLLKKKCNLDVSPATIRNELQELTNKGFVAQPHTSAGRVPTEKGYRYFAQIIFSGKTETLPDFIIKEILQAKERINEELTLIRNLEKNLESIHSALTFNRLEEEMLLEMLKMADISRNTYKQNMDVFEKLIKEFENL